MIYIGNVICAGMDVVEMLFFYSIFFERKVTDNRKFVFCSILAAVLSAIKLYIKQSSMINLCLSLVLFVVIGLVLYKGSRVNLLFTAIVFVIVVMVSETLAQYLIELTLGVSYSAITVDTQAFFAPLSMAIALIIVLYVKKVYKKQLDDIPLKYLIPIMLIPVVSILIILIVDKIIILFDGQGEKLILPLVFMLLYVSFITFDFIESYSNKIQLAMAQEIIEKDRENYKILEENEKELKDLRHDIRNHMQVIKNLKVQGEDSDNCIDNYINKLQNAVNKITSVSYTGNEVLDSILNIKGRRAKALDIRYFVKRNILSDININDIDLSSILCNALDNAVEGAVNTEEAAIVIFVESDDENINFLIENTANEVNLIDGKIETTKRDKKNHGKGMDNIRMCVSKYKGTVEFDYDYDEGIFITNIKMKNIKPNNTVHDKKTTHTTK